MRSVPAAHAALLAANLIYGANYSIAKEVMPSVIQPFGFILMRVGTAALVFWLIGWLSGNLRLVEKKDIPGIILCAFFGVALNQSLFFYGLSITSPINASIMMVCTPLLVLMLAIWMRKESGGGWKVVGVLLGLAGALTLLLFKGKATFSNATRLGDAAVLINALSWGMYLVMVKPYMEKYGAMNIIRYVFLFGFILVIPLGAAQLATVDLASLTTAIWLKIGFVVFGTTVIGYYLNTMALQWSGPTLVSAYIYLQPFLASFFAWITLHELPGLLQITAAMLIFAGVYLSGYRKKESPEAD